MTRTNIASGRDRGASARSLLPVRRLLSVAVVGLFGGLIVPGCAKDEHPGGATLDAGTLECARDQLSRPESAAWLDVPGTRQGYVCPRGDRDWYTLEVPQDQTIVEVSLKMDVQLSPVEANYSLWTIDDAGDPGSVVASPPFTAVGQSLDNIHCVEPGQYLLSVNDAGDDSADLRNQYQLDIGARADGDDNEPNNTRQSATALSSGQTTTGYISCPGDHDRFRIEVPAGNLVKLHLKSPVATYEPTLDLTDEDDQVVAHEVNRSGRVHSTVIDRFATLPAAGTYYVTVADDNDLDADPEVPYELSVEFVADTDPNEPNNSADTATALSTSPMSCGSDWSRWVEMTGTIGAPGDTDWFAAPVRDCAGDILEADLRFDTSSMSGAEQWEFNTDLQASVSMVVAEPNSPCNADSECASLQVSCSQDLDCAGLLEQCLPDGLCSGAATCLPGGFCGANRRQRNYSCNPRLPECQAANSAAPPPNRAHFAAPLPAGSPVFLRVSDFQANAAAPDTTYRLRVRLRNETDTHEPSNVFTNDLVGALPVSRHRQKATNVPVYDCAGGATCCSSGQWTSGAISYDTDLDWYTYNHPCPGEDCMLKFHYRVDGGPVDTVMNVYTGSSPWYTVLDADEQATQGGVSGTVGGTASADRCFYSFQNHTGDPYKYGLLVRDVRELRSDGATPAPESRDWAPGQTYSFCIEKVFNGCKSPCTKVNGECTTP